MKIVSDKMNPLLGIIIPNYNNEKYLRNCMESVLAQTYRPIEVIIVDDCSTDNSKKVIDEFACRTSELCPVYLSENKGVSNARNTGANYSKAEYITFLDADDFYTDPSKLENEMMLLLSRERQGIKTAVFSRLKAVDDKGRHLWDYITRKQFSGGVLRRYILEESNIQLPRDYCMKKQWFLDAGQYEYGNSLYEDLEFLFRLSLQVDFLCTGEQGSAYRITNQGLSSAGVKKHRDALRDMRRKCMTSVSAVDKVMIYVGLCRNRSVSWIKYLCKKLLKALGLK